MSRIRNERDQLLQAVNDLLNRAADVEAVGPIPGNPSDYVSSVDMTCALIGAVRLADPAEVEAAANRARELADELAVANAKITEFTTAAAEKKTVRDTRPIVGVDLASATSVVGMLDGRVGLYPRQTGKLVNLHPNPTAQPRKSEAEIRNEVLTKVIEALQLDTYGYHDPSEPRTQAAMRFIAKWGAPKPDPEGFWADIQSTLADRADDAECDRVEAARKRIEGLTAAAKGGDESESTDYDLAGEKLADVA